MILRATQTLVALAIGIATMPVQHARADTAPSADDFFGVNIQVLVYSMPERLESQLNAVRASGIDVVRFDAAWNAVEPRPPVDGERRYVWRRFDPIVRELAERGLRWLPIVDYSAGWAASQPGNLRSPPREIADYAAYAGALATRYGRNGSFWRDHPRLPKVPVTAYELWNAPNYETTAFPVDRYADAYLQSRAAIRAADPDARVMVGGLALGAPEFLTQMLEHRPELHGNIDAVGLHPYAADPQGIVGYIRELREKMDELGMVDVPIAVTEIGWSTQGRQSVPKASDAGRARYLASLTDVLTRSDCAVNAVLPHTWVTLERNSMDAEDWFGMYGPSGGHTATSRAYAAAISRNKAWLDANQQAGKAVCGRRPAIAVSSRFRPARTVRRSARASGRRRSSRRLRARTCQRTRVTLEGRALRGARVSFRYEDRRGRIRRSVTRSTTVAGVATDCVIRPRRERRQRWRLHVSASRTDLARIAATRTRVLVR